VKSNPCCIEDSKAEIGVLKAESESNVQLSGLGVEAGIEVRVDEHGTKFAYQSFLPQTLFGMILAYQFQLSLIQVETPFWILPTLYYRSSQDSESTWKKQAMEEEVSTQELSAAGASNAQQEYLRSGPHY